MYLLWERIMEEIHSLMTRDRHLFEFIYFNYSLQTAIKERNKTFHEGYIIPGIRNY